MCVSVIKRFRTVFTSITVITSKVVEEKTIMEPIVLFGIQFTFSLVVYAIIAAWYIMPRLSKQPREIALAALLWVHVFRVVGGTILAPGAVEAAVPMDFRIMVGLGDMVTATLALVAVAALHNRWRYGIALAWLCVIVGALDTINAIIQSMRDNVFAYALGVNWVIVAIYVPALVVSSVLIFRLLIKPKG